MFDNIIEYVGNVQLEFICPVCGNTTKTRFIDSTQYKSIQSDEDSVIEFIEAHSSFDSLALLDDGSEITLQLHSVMCGLKSCKRAHLQQQKEGLLEGIKIPPLYKPIAPAKSTDSEVLGMPGVFYLGKVGAGKTCRAIALLKRFVLDAGGPNKCKYKFINACELFFTLQEEMNTPTSSRSFSILRECMEADILVLDDIGTEKYSEWTTTQIYMLINNRLDNMKLTVVTGNLAEEDIATKFSARIASRFSLYNIVEVRGEDRRKVC